MTCPGTHCKHYFPSDSHFPLAICHLGLKLLSLPYLLVSSYYELFLQEASEVEVLSLTSVSPTYQ